MFLRLYDFLHRRRRLRVTLLVTLVAALAALTATLRYQEDISAFLPLSADNRRAMTLWQHLSASDRIVALFELRDTTQTDPDRLRAAIDTFGVRLREAGRGEMPCPFAATIDYEQLQGLSDLVMDRLPLFLTDEDYSRLATALTDTATARTQMAANKEMLLSPILPEEQVEALQRDPLGWFSPVVRRLQRYQTGVRHRLHDGTIFTPDDRKAIAMLTSPYGGSETARNALLAAQIDTAIAHTEAEMPDLYVHVIGAPTIAVSNAAQIKRDSLVALAIAAVLILALLCYTFRRVRSLLLIVAAIAFGWLAAMGGIALVRSEVSIIVLGIASVIIGIAVNYPLHYVAHLLHQPSPRAALRELVAPLVIGNVTTVGAFLCLVPLEAPAMRDLGLFSSLMLVGTIAYVLVFLPHQTGYNKRANTGITFGENTSDKCGDLSPTDNGTLSAEMLPPPPVKSRRRLWAERGLGVIFLIVTLFLGERSLSVRFDSDMHHINYMTPAQQRDLAAFADLQDQAHGVTVYVAATDSSWDRALYRMETLRTRFDTLQTRGTVLAVRTVDDFLPSLDEQQRRLAQWTAFWTAERCDAALQLIAESGRDAGFRAEAFAPFGASLTNWCEGAVDGTLCATWDDLRPLADGAFSGYVHADATQCTVTAQLQVPDAEVTKLEATLRTAYPDLMVFDMPTVNSAIADTLSNEFNYIGWACGLIVFAFLWASFGRLELAILAFLPMAISWLWILGIMQLCNLQFNIVNVILATFIFGQGDDYTIFITEGLMYEYTYRRRLLKSYKKSILLSALIMFIGIGALIVARHPALHSLAEVTIVGMSAVILAAWVIPPVVFHALVRHPDGRERDVALTFRDVFRPVRRPDHPQSAEDCRAYILAKYRYRGSDIERRARRFFRDNADLIRRIEYCTDPTVHFQDPSQGEAAWLMALLHPHTEVYAIIPDAERRAVAEGLTYPPKNLHLVASE
jgi:predicted exporter